MDGNGDKLDGINYYDYTQASAFQIPFYQLITNWLDVGECAFFCDVDEMLSLDVGSIDKFISLVPNDVDCVLFNWKCYGDNGLDDYEEKPVWERFKNPAPKECIYNDRASSRCYRELPCESTCSQDQQTNYLEQCTLPFDC